MDRYDWLLRELQGVTLLSTFVRLLLAAVLGGMIGMERGRRRRAAGLRTHILVCVGAALAMITNQYIYNLLDGVDPTRLGAQVISGIGFLGVGTIIVDRQQRVRGLTTAAGLWASACMGLALGIGFYSGAMIACVFILSTIAILNRFEDRVVNKSRTMGVYAEFETHADINRFINHMAGRHIVVTQLEVVSPRDYSGSGDKRGAAVMELQLPKGVYHAQALEEAGNRPELLRIEEVR